jgi:hypothetical protein
MRGAMAGMNMSIDKTWRYQLSGSVNCPVDAAVKIPANVHNFVAFEDNNSVVD